MTLHPFSNYTYVTEEELKSFDLEQAQAKLRELKESRKELQHMQDIEESYTNRMLMSGELYMLYLEWIKLDDAVNSMLF